jgi:copper transport protein
VAAIATLAVAGTIGAALAPAAQAAPALPVHATLVTTSPADGQVLPAEPSRVSAIFDQPIGVSPDSLIVYTPTGQRADVGGTQYDGADGVEVTLTAGLGKGTYTAEWHVVSADSHEVQGAFTFSIGATSATHVPVLKSPDANLVAALYAGARWCEYGFFTLLGGSVAFLLFCWPAGARRRGVPGLVITGWAGLIGSTLTALLLQGPYAANVPLGQLLNPTLELATLHTRLGSALQVRQVLAVVAAIAAAAVIRRLPRMTRLTRMAAGLAWGMLTVAIAATWATSDHASTGFQVPLAIAADIMHLTAMALWGGGLVMLAAFALRGPASVAAAIAVRRFSPIALGCVIALGVTGGYMAWRLVGTWGALFGTTYGWLIVAKSVGLGLLICLGYLARRFIHHRLLRAEIRATAVEPARALVPVGGPPDGEVGIPADGDGQGVPSMRDLRRSVTAEVGIVAVVLGLTAVLVNTATGRESYAPPVNVVEHFDTGGPGGAGTLDVSVTPARLGGNQATLTFETPSGQPMRPAQVSAALILPARNIGPLPVTLAGGGPGSDGPGRYKASTITFTFTGNWQLLVTVRTDDFDETTVLVPVNVHQ